MAEQDPMQVLRELAQAYLNPQAYDVEDLKALLAEPGEAARADRFQFALSETLGGDGLDQETWEALTDDDFVDGDAWLEYLDAVYDYLFEDGPYPAEEGEEA